MSLPHPRRTQTGQIERTRTGVEVKGGERGLGLGIKRGVRMIVGSAGFLRLRIVSSISSMLSYSS
jgi:hypothetical protein